MCAKIWTIRSTTVPPLIMVLSSIMASTQTPQWPARPLHKRSPRLSWTFSVSLSLRVRPSQVANHPASSLSLASRYLEESPLGTVEGNFRNLNRVNPQFKKFKLSRYRRITKNTSKMNQRRLRIGFVQWCPIMMKISTPLKPLVDQLSCPYESSQFPSWSLRTCVEWSSQEDSLWPVLVIRNYRSVQCAQIILWDRSLLLT